jgi:hypothetical protein
MKLNPTVHTISFNIPKAGSKNAKGNKSLLAFLLAKADRLA